MALLACFFAALIAYFIYKWTRGNRQARLLNALPGPPTVPLFGNLLDGMIPREELFQMLIDWDKKYTPMYRSWTGPMYPNIHIMKPHLFEIFLSNTKHITKGPLYDFLHPWLGTGLLTSSGSKWFKHRKMLTPTFHFQVLDNFTDIFNDNAKILVEKLREKAVPGVVVDIYPYITLCALDIICESSMGTKIDAQKKEQSEYVQSVYKFINLLIQRVLNLLYHIDFIFFLVPMGKEYKRTLDIIHGFSEKVIKERMETREKERKGLQTESQYDDLGRKKKKAFLDLMLDASESESIQLTLQEIREEVDTFMFEGHDTTTAGICWALLLLGHHPEIQEQAYEEQKAIFGDDPNKPITMKHLGEMKLLERIIKEALRLYPSVPTMNRILEEDVPIGKYVIPKGVSVFFHLYTTHRDPESFPNPHEFNPDNFLPERVQSRHPYAYVPFSAGPRNCIGQRFAILEEKTVLATIIRNYKLESVEKLSDIKLIFELILRSASGIKLRLTPRHV